MSRRLPGGGGAGCCAQAEACLSTMAEQVGTALQVMREPMLVSGQTERTRHSYRHRPGAHGVHRESRELWESGQQAWAGAVRPLGDCVPGVWLCPTGHPGTATPHPSHAASTAEANRATRPGQEAPSHKVRRTALS